MKIHSKILLILKLIISPILILWLIKNDHFSIENLKLGLTNSHLFIVFVLLTLLQLILSSYRTQILFRFKKINLQDFIVILKISWASIFINCIAPSSIFGDFFRIKELIKFDSEVNKDNSVYASIFSKFFSFLGLITVSLFATIAFGNNYNVNLKTISYLSFAILFFSLTAFFLGEKISLGVENLIQYMTKSLKNNFIQKRIHNFNLYLAHLLRNKSISLKAFLSSLSIQIFNTTSLILIIYALNPETSANPLLLIALVPIGIFLMTLPISFSGLGVGHLAFAELLKIVGIYNGADVFTIFFAFSFLFNLIGIIPFFYIWKK